MWCDQLRRVSQFCGVEVMTYVVLDNHFHLLVRVPRPADMTDGELIERCRALYPQRPKLVREIEATLAEGGSPAEVLRNRLLARMHDISMFLKELKQRFTMWFNARHKLYGTIWAERFKSILVENGASVLRTVGAYIDLNPLRAAIVKSPEKYPWCGIAAAERGDALARAGLTAMVGGKDWAESRKIYRRFVDDATLGQHEGKADAGVKSEGLQSGPSLLIRQPSISGGWILGSRDFVLARHGSGGEVIAAPRARNCVSS
jgi:hypothetical protein